MRFENRDLKIDNRKLIESKIYTIKSRISIFDSLPFLPVLNSSKNGGEAGIRTLGPVKDSCSPSRCTKPLCDLSVFYLSLFKSYLSRLARCCISRKVYPAWLSSRHPEHLRLNRLVLIFRYFFRLLLRRTLASL